MAKHEFGIMQITPLHGQLYERYEPEKYPCISINDNYIEPLLTQFAELDFYWHTLDVPKKGLAYYGITLISPASYDKLISMIKDKEGLQGLEYLLIMARNENKYIIHFGI